MYGAALQAMSLAARSFDAARSTEVVLPRIDPVTAMLQFALDSHAVEHSHVMYQSMNRWLLQGFGMADAQPDGSFDHLLEFGVAQHALFGAACSHLAHGPGSTAGSNISTPADYFRYVNSGQFSERTVHRALPASAQPGAQLHQLLNLFDAVRSDAGAVTYAPVAGRVNTLVNLGLDGMSLGKGCMVDEQRLQACGFEEPVGVEEAKAVLAMEDAELQTWSAEHPLLSDAVEFIVTAADNSVSGNIGFFFVSSEGTHAAVAKRITCMLRPLRTCYCCLRWASQLLE